MRYFGLVMSYIWLCICILYIVWYNANCVFSQYTIFWWIWSTINFFPSKGSLTLFQIRINFNLDIDKYLISAVSINNRIAKLISSISLENWAISISQFYQSYFHVLQAILPGFLKKIISNWKPHHFVSECVWVWQGS